MRARTSLRGWAQAGVLGAVVVVAMLLGGLVTASVVDDDDTAAPGAAPAAEESRSLPVASQSTPSAEGSVAATAALPNLPELVDRVRSSVVVIDTVVTSRTGRQGQGTGTGVVVDKQGHIVTNFHVVEGAEQVSVEFADGTKAAGQVVGSDPANDLAVVKVSLPANALNPARLGNSDGVRLGEAVFAIGNPFSLKFTVTSGIVSGLERESRGLTGRPLRGVIQTDAAVNPGNSGGPLFNANGEVIGINSSIENPTGQRVFVGVGFAIPSNTVQRFLPDMIAGRAITHPQLGVSGQSLTEANAKDAGVDVQKGVYITSVGAGSAADRAGLRAASVQDGGALLAGGDVVVAINGKEVTTIQQLARTVDGYKVGDQVKLTVVRGGRQIELTATLLEWTG